MNPSKALAILLAGFVVGAAEVVKATPDCFNYFTDKSNHHQGAIMYCYWKNQGTQSFEGLRDVYANHPNKEAVWKEMNKGQLKTCCKIAGTTPKKHESKFQKAVKDKAFATLNESDPYQHTSELDPGFWLDGATTLDRVRLFMKPSYKAYKKRVSRINKDRGVFWLCGNLAKGVLQEQPSITRKRLIDKTRGLYKGVFKASAYSLAGRRLARGRSRHRGQGQNHKKTGNGHFSTALNTDVRDACDAGSSAEYHYWKGHYNTGEFILAEFLNAKTEGIKRDVAKSFGKSFDFAVPMKMKDLIYWSTSPKYFPTKKN